MFRADFMAPHLMLAESEGRVLCAAQGQPEGHTVVRGSSPDAWDDRLRQVVMALDGLCSLLLLAGWNTDAIEISRGGVVEQIQLKYGAICGLARGAWRVPVEVLTGQGGADGVRLTLAAHNRVGQPVAVPNVSGSPPTLSLPLGTLAGAIVDASAYEKACTSVKDALTADSGLLGMVAGTAWAWRQPATALLVTPPQPATLTKDGKPLVGPSEVPDAKTRLGLGLLPVTPRGPRSRRRTAWRRAHGGSLSAWLDLHNAGFVRLWEKRAGDLPREWWGRTDWNTSFRIQLSQPDVATTKRVAESLIRDPAYQGQWAALSMSEEAVFMLATRVSSRRPSIGEITKSLDTLTQTSGNYVEPFARETVEEVSNAPIAFGGDESEGLTDELYHLLDSNPHYAQAAFGPYAEVAELVRIARMSNGQLEGETAQQISVAIAQAKALEARAPRMSPIPDYTVPANRSAAQTRSHRTTLEHLTGSNVADFLDDARLHAVAVRGIDALPDQLGIPIRHDNPVDPPGTGVVVLHLDTGIQRPSAGGPMHPLLMDQHTKHPHDLDPGNWDYITSDIPIPFEDHGLSTGAMIAGFSGSGRFIPDTDEYGVAPGVRLISKAVTYSVFLNLDPGACKAIHDVIDAYTGGASTGNNEEPEPDVISMSIGLLDWKMFMRAWSALPNWGSELIARVKTLQHLLTLLALDEVVEGDKLEIAMRRAEDKGIIVCAAGAQSGQPFDIEMPIAFPAQFPTVIACRALRRPNLQKGEKGEQDPGWGFRFKAAGPVVAVRGVELCVAKWAGATPALVHSEGSSYATAITAGVTALWLQKWKGQIAAKIHRPNVYRYVLASALANTENLTPVCKHLDAQRLLEFSPHKLYENGHISEEQARKWLK